MTGEFVTAEHLGGYVAGGDPDCMYPNLWKWLVDQASQPGEIVSVLDVGCGDGAAMRAFDALGCAVVGIDGVEQDDDRILLHDYTTGASPVGLMFDIVWSCEFVEHVEEQYVENFLPDLTLGHVVAMTHALPGQPGWHHVNCQPSEYWIDRLQVAGLLLDTASTAAARMLAGHGYFAETGLIFRWPR